MQLSFMGGVREIGASAASLQIAGKQIVIDAGMRSSASQDVSCLPKLARIKAGGSQDETIVCLTHTHLDHLGAVPAVAYQYPKIPFVTTQETFSLMRLVLMSSAEVTGRLSLDGPKREQQNEQRQLAQEANVKAALEHTYTTAFGQWFTPFPKTDLKIAFFPAGHILGAAMVAVDDGQQKILFTGDFSMTKQATIPGWQPFDFKPDVVVMEATYGDSEHPPRQEQEENLVQAILKVLERKGRVLIPAFAVGRGQEILAILHRFQQQGRLPAVPVYYDGFIREVAQRYIEAGVLAPFSPQGVIHPVTSLRDREAILKNPEPCVIVATSGNLQGGPAVTYAEVLLPDAKNAVFLSGHQDEESPGRRLLNGMEEGMFKTDRKIVPVRAEMALYQFSAHADAKELEVFIDTLQPKVVVLNHGEWKTCLSLAERLRDRTVVWLPDNHLTFDPLDINLEEALRKQYAQAGQKVRAALARYGHQKAAPQTEAVAVSTESTPAVQAPVKETAFTQAPARAPAAKAKSVPLPRVGVQEFTLAELYAHIRPAQKILGVKFQQEAWLLQALTHRSFINESRVAGLVHNERLEFIGDAIIEYVITLQLFKRFGGVAEGDLSNARAVLVNAEVLSMIAERLGLEPYILTSRGERRDWSSGDRPSNRARRFILANTLEAIVGGIHQDRGLGLAELFLSDVLFPLLEQIAQEGIPLDPKGAFQEIAQARFRITPEYRIVSERGSDRNKWFMVECLLDERVVGQGEGGSKFDGQVAAASDALERMFGLKVYDLKVKMGEIFAPATRAPRDTKPSSSAHPSPLSVPRRRGKK